MAKKKSKKEEVEEVHIVIEKPKPPLVLCGNCANSKQLDKPYHFTCSNHNIKAIQYSKEPKICIYFKK